MATWKLRSEIVGDVVFFPYRDVDRGGASEIYVWDLDKTYLDTSWHTIGDLWRTVFEKSFQKRNVPGTSTLVSSVKDNWQRTRGEAGEFPLFFITASPPQLEDKIREKLEIDEILPQGIFFKDNLRNVHPSRWRRLSQQVGYKIQALMQLRSKFSEDLTQVLWGDDSETDATIYSLYSDICSRRWDEDQLIKFLKHFNVTKEQINTILDLQDQCPSHDPVEKVYINLAVDTDPEYYLKFGRRIVPTYNSFQTSLDLFQDSRLQEAQVLKVAMDLMTNYGFTPDQLQQDLDDLVRRRILAQETLERVLPVLQENQIISSDYTPSVTPGKVESQVGDRVFGVRGEMEPWIP
ncbi:MAG: phosphatase domain-containing protein, partial [Pseudomonadota bacterium]